MVAEVMTSELRIAFAELLHSWEQHLEKEIQLSPADAKMQVGYALIDMGKEVVSQAYGALKIEKATDVLTH